jgi:hypothetical protein
MPCSLEFDSVEDPVRIFRLAGEPVARGERASRIRFKFTAVPPARTPSRSPLPSMIAFTSKWLATCGASSLRLPASTFTTPGGMSLVATISQTSMQAAGCLSDATTTAVLPVRITGASSEIMASRGGWSGTTMATTPVGSGIVKLKCGELTGFTEPKTCDNLSVHPAK